MAYVEEVLMPMIYSELQRWGKASDEVVRRVEEVLGVGQYAPPPGVGYIAEPEPEPEPEPSSGVAVPVEVAAAAAATLESDADWQEVVEAAKPNLAEDQPAMGRAQSKPKRQFGKWRG